MHHLNPQDFYDIYGREERFGFRRLWLADIYQTIYPQGFHSREIDWDNLADAREHALSFNSSQIGKLTDPNDSFSACRADCRSDLRCQQFTWCNATVKGPKETYSSRYSCLLSATFRLGHPRSLQKFGQNSDELDTYRAWQSGWMQDRIANWVEMHGNCSTAMQRSSAHNSIGDDWVF